MRISAAAQPSDAHLRRSCYDAHNQTFSPPHAGDGWLGAEVSLMDFYKPRINYYAQGPFTNGGHLDISTTWRGIGEKIFLAEALANLEHSFRSALELAIRTYFRWSAPSETSCNSGSQGRSHTMHISVPVLAADMIRDFKKHCACNSRSQFLTKEDVVDRFIRLHDCFALTDHLGSVCQSTLQVELHPKIESHSQRTGSTFAQVKWCPDVLKFEDLQLYPHEGQSYYLTPRVVSALQGVTVTYASTCPWLSYNGQYFQGTVPSRENDNYKSLTVVIRAMIKLPLDCEDQTVYLERIIRTRLEIWPEHTPELERVDSLNIWQTPSCYRVMAKGREAVPKHIAGGVPLSRPSSLSISSLSLSDMGREYLQRPRFGKVSSPTPKYWRTLAAYPGGASSFESMVEEVLGTCHQARGNRFVGEGNPLLMEDGQESHPSAPDISSAGNDTDEPDNNDSDGIYFGRYNPFNILRKRRNMDRSSESIAATSGTTNGNTRLVVKEESAHEQHHTGLSPSIQEQRPLLPSDHSECQRGMPGGEGHSCPSEFLGRHVCQKEGSRQIQPFLIRVDEAKKSDVLAAKWEQLPVQLFRQTGAEDSLGGELAHQLDITATKQAWSQSPFENEDREAWKRCLDRSIWRKNGEIQGANGHICNRGDSASGVEHGANHIPENSPDAVDALVKSTHASDTELHGSTSTTGRPMCRAKIKSKDQAKPDADTNAPNKASTLEIEDDGLTQRKLAYMRRQHNLSLGFDSDEDVRDVIEMRKQVLSMHLRALERSMRVKNAESWAYGGSPDDGADDGADADVETEGESADDSGFTLDEDERLMLSDIPEASVDGALEGQ